MKNELLHKIMHELRNMKTVKVLGRNGYGTIKIGFGNGGWFLFWNHFGSSAQRITLKNLKWILDVIFESKNYEYSIE